MAEQARPVPSNTWVPVMRIATTAQYVLAASCLAGYVLYAIALGDVSGNRDPKDLVPVFAEVLHAIAILGVILGPWAGIPFALVTLFLLARYGGRLRGGGWLIAGTVAVALTAAVALTGLLPVAEPLQRWLLD